MIKKFDLFVIGGGSAGVAHARRAAEYGAKVAVAEYGPLGGTCVNVGCVPKKVMWYTASLAHQFEHAADYGFNVSVEGHDWSVVKSHRDAYVNRLNVIYEKMLDGSGVEYLADAARFVDAHTVAVGGQEYSAERIVIATGGRPIVPDVPGAALGITSDGFFELEERPERVLVVGSGYVAVELAGVFSGLGTDTQLLVRKQSIVRDFDAMLGSELMKAMRESGIAVETGV
ncbi:MAG: FAD-dependent oxidoreductase, partial [Woeseiaceae bacterium]